VDFAGTATVEIRATSDDQTYASEGLATDLSFRNRLTPTASAVVGGVIFVNDQIEVDGDGFLLGGDEGTTYARIAGCFQPDSGGSCDPIQQQDVAMVPLDPLSRTKAAFPFT